MKKHLYLFVNYHNLFVFLSFLEITLKNNNFQLKKRKKKFKKKSSIWYKFIRIKGL